MRAAVAASEQAALMAAREPSMGGALGLGSAHRRHGLAAFSSQVAALLALAPNRYRLTHGHGAPFGKNAAPIASNARQQSTSHVSPPGLNDLTELARSGAETVTT